MLKKKAETVSTIPVAPVATLENNIEFGFEHELKEAENKVQNNGLNNINSALIKTYKNKVFKINPYKDLNPVSIENSNIQLDDSNDFLSGEVKAKVLDETLNDISHTLKTPLINDIIVDTEADKEGSQKRYLYTIELLENENNNELSGVQTIEFEEIHSSPDELALNELGEATKLAEDIAEERNELDKKISDFDQVQTYISNDIEFSPKAEGEAEVSIDDDFIENKYQLEAASINYKNTEILIPEEIQTVEEEDVEVIDLSDIIEQVSNKYYEYLRIKEEQEKLRALKEAKRKEQDEIENRIVEDILNSIEESFKIEEAKKQAEDCDLRIPSNVYILSVQNFIPLPDEPTPEIKAQMDENLIDIQDRLEELPMIIFRDEHQDEVEEIRDVADTTEQIEVDKQPEYYVAPIQDFNLDDTLGRVEETPAEETTSVETDNYSRTRNGDLSYEDIEEAFFNIKTVNESVAEVEQEANDLGLNSSFDSGVNLAKAAKIEALVEKKKAERKILLAEERLQAELEKQQLEERIKAIQDKINLVKQMNLSDFKSEELEPTIPVVQNIVVEPEPKLDQTETQEIVETRRRGRPAGSKNKKTLKKEARERRKLEKLGLTEMPVVPKKRGRPLGSKNKKK